MAISSLERPTLRIYISAAGLISAATSLSMPDGTNHHWIGGTEDPNEFITWIRALELGELGNPPVKFISKFYLEDESGESIEACAQSDRIPTELRFLNSKNS